MHFVREFFWNKIGISYVLSKIYDDVSNIIGYYTGQLAQDSRTIVPQPEVVDYFLSVHLLVNYISAGDKHCAAITNEGELYTWGSNANGCLGRYRMYFIGII